MHVINELDGWRLVWTEYTTAFWVTNFVVYAEYVRHTVRTMRSIYARMRIYVSIVDTQCVAVVHIYLGSLRYNAISTNVLVMYILRICLRLIHN